MVVDRPTALNAYLQSVLQKEFDWGEHDCALFTANWVKEITGRDLARGFRGYKTLRSGMKKLKEKGYTDHIALAADKLQEILYDGEPAPIMAQLGDIAVVESDTGPALGIVGGPHVWVLRMDGLGRVPITDAVRAFKVE